MVTIHRAAVGLLTAILVAQAAGAQDAAGSWEELLGAGALKVGDAVTVNGVRGHIRLVSMDSVALTTRSGAQSWSIEEVHEVQRRDSIENGFWMGLGLAVIPVCVFHRSADGAFYVTSRWGGAVLLGGGLIGGLVDGWVRETVYQGDGGRVGVAVRMSDGAFGGGMTLEW